MTNKDIRTHFNEQYKLTTDRIHSLIAKDLGIKKLNQKIDAPVDRYRCTDGALHAHHFSVICKQVFLLYQRSQRTRMRK